MAEGIVTDIGAKTTNKKSGGFARKIIIILIILIILGAIVFAWVSVKHPEWLDTTNVQTNNVTNVVTPTPLSNAKGSGTTTLLIILGIGAVVSVVGYLVWKNTGGKSTMEHPKVPVSPDRAVILFKEHFSRNYNIECRYDNAKEIASFIPANSNAIIVNDRRPFYHTATGDNFFMLEIEVREGIMQGLHTVIIPIDRGEEVIKGGWYRLDTHTPQFQFKLNRSYYPLSSLADKQDRLRIAMMDRMEDSGSSSDDIQKMLPKQQEIPQNIIQTPLEQSMPTPAPYNPPTRRKYYYPKRRSYRR